MTTLQTIIDYVSRVTPEMNNASGASIFSRLIQVFADIIDIIKLEIAKTTSTIYETAHTLKVLGRQYYVDVALAFQLGDDVTLINAATYQYGYATIDTTKQIVKQCIVFMDGNVIRISVAQQTNGANAALTSVQLTDFTDYMTNFTPLGVLTRCSSTTPDVINGNLNIYYAAQYSLTAITAAVKKALTDFQTAQRQSNRLYINSIETALRNVDGIVDAYITNAKLTHEGTTTSIIGAYVNVPSAYFNFDPSVSASAKYEAV